MLLLLQGLEHVYMQAMRGLKQILVPLLAWHPASDHAEGDQLESVWVPAVTAEELDRLLTSCSSLPVLARGSKAPPGSKLQTQTAAQA